MNISLLSLVVILTQFWSAAAQAQYQVQFLASRSSWSEREFVGHAFMIISDRVKEGVKEDCYGFYPKNGLGIIGGPGIIHSEFQKNAARMSRVTVSVKGTITEAQRNSLLKLAAEWNEKGFSLTNANCIDFIASEAKTLGWKTPPREPTDLPTEYLHKLKELQGSKEPSHQ